MGRSLREQIKELHAELEKSRLREIELIARIGQAIEDMTAAQEELEDMRDRMKRRKKSSR